MVHYTATPNVNMAGNLHHLFTETLKYMLLSVRRKDFPPPNT